ncbi:MAG: hypothetical protein JO111_16460 [Caulobacteraceae bacterium]|nr:hypothetical protein [Caulobacteraceae bacterium]
MPAAPTPTSAHDPAVLRAEWRLRMIEELAEIGMDLARTLHRQALAAAEPMEPADADTTDTPTTTPTNTRASATSPADLANDFARLSRAVRLTLTLHTRTDESHRALQAGIAAEQEVARAEAARRASDEVVERRVAWEKRVDRLVSEVAEREIADENALSDVYKALEERLEQDEAYFDQENLSLRDTVERLCADLELTPDWSLWEGEGWTPNPPFHRRKASIFCRSSRRPLTPPFRPVSHPTPTLAAPPRRLE